MEEKFIKDFNSEIELAFSAAYHSEKGGDEKWDEVLKFYNIRPLSEEEKESLLNSEMKIAKGAFPIELRRVYEKIIGKYSDMVEGNQKLRGVLNNFNMESHVIEYYQKIKPFMGLNDIFKNASNSLTKYSQGMQKAKHHTIKCKSCGAPRLEEMQYDDCLFCGSKLFETSN